MAIYEYPQIPENWKNIRVPYEDDQHQSSADIYDMSLTAFNAFIVGWLHGTLVRQRKERPDGLEIAPLNGILFRFSSFICDPYSDTAYVDVSIFGLDNLEEGQTQPEIAQLKVSIFTCLVLELENEPFRGDIISTEIIAGQKTEIIERTEDANLHLPQYVKLSPLSSLSDGDTLFTIKFNLTSSRHIAFEDGTEDDFESKFIQLYIGTNTTSLNRDNPAASPNFILTSDNNYHETLGEWGAVLMPGPDGRLQGSNTKMPVGYDNIDKGNTDNPPVYPPQTSSYIRTKIEVPDDFDPTIPVIVGIGSTTGECYLVKGINYVYWPMYGGSSVHGSVSTPGRQRWSGGFSILDGKGQPAPRIINQRITNSPTVTTNPKRVRTKNKDYEQVFNMEDRLEYRFKSASNEMFINDSILIVDNMLYSIRNTDRKEVINDAILLSDDMQAKLKLDLANLSTEEQIRLADDVVYFLKSTTIKLTSEDKLMLQDSVLYKLFSSNIKEKILDELLLSDDLKYTKNSS